jgi:hypothetical protein
METVVTDFTKGTTDATQNFYVRTAGAFTLPLSLTGTTATIPIVSATQATISAYAQLGGSSTTTGATTSQKLEGQTLQYRSYISNASTSVATANYGIASLFVSPRWTEGTSGTHNMIAGVAVDKGKIVVGAATVGNTSALYIAGRMNATTLTTGKNWAMFIKNDDAYFGGNATIKLGVRMINTTLGACDATTRGMQKVNVTWDLFYCNRTLKWKKIA